MSDFTLRAAHRYPFPNVSAAHIPLADLVDLYVKVRLGRGEIRAITGQGLVCNLRLFAQAVGDPPIRQLKRDHVEAWLIKANRELRPATVRTRFSQIRLFCGWAVAEGYLKADPTIGLRAPRQPRQVPRALRLEDVAATLTVCPDNRSRLIVLLAVQEGLRRKEVTGLELGDIDLDQGVALVRGKGDHERVVPLSEETKTALHAYLAERPAFAGPLLRNETDGVSPLAPVTVGRMVSDLMREAGVKQRAYDGKSMHAFRHTAATDMVRAGAHLRDVQFALGHRSLATTEKYLAWEIRGLRKAMSGRRYLPTPRALEDTA